MVFVRFLVLYGLFLFFSTYGVSFGPLGVEYRATRVFDSGWIEYFGGQGLYLITLKVNHKFGLSNNAQLHNNSVVSICIILCINIAQSVQ
jgi:hypothetical protein